MNNIGELEQLYKTYQLSTEEHNKIFNKICKIMFKGKKTNINPTVVINIAPPGSGKTGLNGMSLRDFENNNAIIINGDELKTFHPKSNEVAKLYPEHYARIINKDSNPWTDNLFDLAINNNYNVIFEGTGRNIKLMLKMIQKSNNHTIIVRGMAVNEANCLMSILERYRGQVLSRGYGRLVSKDTFYKAYSEMLENIDELEKSGLVDLVEVYTRGNKPSTPIKIYETHDKTFRTAKSAIISFRNMDIQPAIDYFEKNFSNKLFFEEEKEILDKLNSLLK